MLSYARQILEKLFGKAPGSEGFQWGAGVVGYTTRAIIAFCSVCGVIVYALSHSPIIAVAAMVIVGAVTAYYLHGTWRFADKHPEAAAMGGSNYRRWRELQMAAQGYPTLPISQPIADPGYQLLATDAESEPAEPLTISGAPDGP